MLHAFSAVGYYYGSFTSYYGGKAILNFTASVHHNNS
jgi:hypothetical protein